MASSLGRLFRVSVLRNGRETVPSAGAGGARRTVTPHRSVVTTSSGAVLPKPKKVSGCCEESVDMTAGIRHRTRCFHELTDLFLWWPDAACVCVCVCVTPWGADHLRPNPDCCGSGALLICGDSDQQELCCAAGGARHLCPGGRRRR